MTQKDIKINYEGEDVYLINFPVGDWSDDGHGKCNYYFVTSKKPTNEVREAHFNAEKVLGFDIGDICSEYEDSSLNENVIAKLKELNYDLNKITDGDEIRLSSSDIIDIWIYLLNNINNTLELKLFEIPMINFYGYDEDKRRLRTPGYGVFGC